MPRINGARRVQGVLPDLWVSQVSTSMLPSGIRVAILVRNGPRIIMPSMRACPPIEVFFLLFAIWVISFLSYPLASGKVMVTVVPSPLREVSFRLPPCILMISSATASPMPEPRREDFPL